MNDIELHKVIEQQQKEIEDLKASLAKGARVIEKLKNLSRCKSRLEGEEVWEHAGEAFEVINKLQQICKQEQHRDKTEEDTRYGELYHYLEVMRGDLLGGNPKVAHRFIRIAVEKGKVLIGMAKENVELSIVIDIVKQPLS